MSFDLKSKLYIAIISSLYKHKVFVKDNGNIQLLLVVETHQSPNGDSFSCVVKRSLISGCLLAPRKQGWVVGEWNGGGYAPSSTCGTAANLTRRRRTSLCDSTTSLVAPRQTSLFSGRGTEGEKQLQTAGRKNTQARKRLGVEVVFLLLGKSDCAEVGNPLTFALSPVGGIGTIG